MLRATLSILGLWNWDNKIFDDFKVPSEMDKDIVISEILAQCSELELVYPNYDVMKELIKNWNIIELPIWERVYRDCTIEYNPIWNKDGVITENFSQDIEYDKAGTNTQKSVTQPINNTSTDSTKGYNSNSWTETDKNVTNLGLIDNTSTETPDLHDREHGWRHTERIEQGNIGVTKTQEMLNDDLDLLPRLNPYQYIVDSFRRRFCLLVY